MQNTPHDIKAENATIRYLMNFFIARHPAASIDVQENFYHQGLIDSFGIIELIESLESEFNIQFSQDDFMSENFSSINGLAKIVTDKIQQ